MKIIKRYKSIIQLEEGFSEKNMEKAVKIIKSLLQKKLGVTLNNNSKSQYFRKRRGQELFGQKYMIDGGKQALRFNWSTKRGDNEIRSIDIFTKKRSVPTWTISVAGQGVVQIMNLVVNVFEGIIDKKFVHLAEPEVQLEEPTILKGQELDKEKGELGRYHKAVNYFLTTLRTGKESYFPSKQDKSKNFKLAGVSAINVQDFLDWYYDNLNKVSGIKELEGLRVKNAVTFLKQRIDNGDFFTLGSGKDSLVVSSLNPNSESARFRKSEILDQFTSHVQDYFVKALDSLIKKHDILKEVGKYQECNSYDLVASFILEKDQALVTSLVSNDYDGMEKYIIQGYFYYLKNFSKVKIDGIITKQELKEVENTSYGAHKEEFEKAFIKNIEEHEGEARFSYDLIALAKKYFISKKFAEAKYFEYLYNFSKTTDMFYTNKNIEDYVTENFSSVVIEVAKEVESHLEIDIREALNSKSLDKYLGIEYSDSDAKGVDSGDFVYYNNDEATIDFEVFYEDFLNSINMTEEDEQDMWRFNEYEEVFTEVVSSVVKEKLKDSKFDYSDLVATENFDEITYKIDKSLVSLDSKALVEVVKEALVKTRITSKFPKYGTLAKKNLPIDLAEYYFEGGYNTGYEIKDQSAITLIDPILIADINAFGDLIVSINKYLGSTEFMSFYKTKVEYPNKIYLDTKTPSMFEDVKPYKSVLQLHLNKPHN